MASSVLAHILFWVGLSTVDAGDQPEDDSFVVEVDIAPPPPEAADRLTSLEDEPSRTDTVAAVEPEPTPEPEPEPEPVIDPDIAIDAGVAEIDAAPEPDARAVASTDAGSVDPDAGPEVASAGSDAGPDNPDAGAGTDPDVTAHNGPVGVGVDLGFAAPTGDHLAVLLRFDRIRGTVWQEPAEKILAPMPDYRMIIGARDVSIIDRLDLLMISSSDPTDVTATNLAGRTPGSAADLRTFLDHPRSPVTWSQAKGGPLGAIKSAQFTSNADQRVYLAPMAGWIILADRKHLGALVQPDGAPLGQLPAMTSLPAWMQQLPKLVAATGAGSAIDDGPAVALSARGLPATLKIPMVGKLTAPRHMTAALQIHQLGFIVRGSMQFADAEEASAFIAKVTSTRSALLSSPVTAAPLKRFNAYNALNGLALKQLGNKVSYATSISVPDARAIMKLAASQTATWYLRRGGGIRLRDK